jgi:hypothetical protein
LEAFQLV